MKPVSLLLAQTGPKVGNKERNVRQISDQAAKARQQNVDFLIFPELHMTGLSITVLNFADHECLQALPAAPFVVCCPVIPGFRGRILERSCLSRAMENAMYLAYGTRVAIEEGLKFWGESRLIAPHGSDLEQR